MVIIINEKQLNQKWKVPWHFRKKLEQSKKKEKKEEMKEIRN